jgi:hypothetical protein
VESYLLCACRRDDKAGAAYECIFARTSPNDKYWRCVFKVFCDSVALHYFVFLEILQGHVFEVGEFDAVQDPIWQPMAADARKISVE